MMQTLRKKTSPCKYRNDPGRFFGDGVTFKAKLIGILEVGEARGDKMCQEALQDLKMAIRAAGEHKQRITIHVTIDGLRLRDEKSSDSLYHHPVHKISFIAQDMSDSRAFGYIFGSPDSGHRFFGIKTDKAASQVVLAMRDLFQVVFELKKKEIELARQHIQSKTIHEHQPVALSVRSTTLESSGASFSKTSSTEPSTSKTASKMSPESVADLVDLEQELSSIQRGITQMEQITPSDPTAKTTTEEDPFGDSFTKFPAYNLLPPPESSKSRHSKPLKPPDDQKPSGPVQPLPVTTAPPTTTTTSTATSSAISTNDWLSTPPPAAPPSATSFDEPKSISSVFDDTNDLKKEDTQINATDTTTALSSEQFIDAFSDLDPLGTGKIKPYIDKKYFFQDLKNPPKKVLKDLTEQDSVFSANFSTADTSTETGSADSKDSDLKMFESSADFTNGTSTKDIDFASNFSKPSAATAEPFSSFGQSTQSIFKVEHKTDDPIIGNNKALLVTDNDPFSPRMKKFDPFEDDFSKASLDPFDFTFAKGKSTILPDTKIGNDDKPKIHADKKIHTEKKMQSDFNGPLQVNLPPEGYTSYMSQQKRIERHNSDASDSMGNSVSGSTSASRNRPSVFKQNTVDVINSISSKKMKPHLFSQKYSKRDSNSINMRRLQESDSLSETETAPEPPPRPDTMSHIEPPPLPPKKQFSDIVIKPRVTSPLAMPTDTSRYDYVGSKIAQNDNSPAIPLPSRKVSRTDSNFPGPNRPAKKKDEDDYLTPLSSSEMPILLPPPQAKGSLKNRGRRQPEPVAQNPTPPPQSSKSDPKNIDISLPDITLSQLLTLGIDDLATKLNVPTNKLSTMNIVELTKYLSDFIEKSSKPSGGGGSSHQQQQPEVAIFKVSFDESSDSTFVAKFDDNFGEDDNSFVPDFEKFNPKPEAPVQPGASIDKYAVFREIIEQEMKSEEEDEHPNDRTSSVGSEDQNSDNDSNANEEIPPTMPIVARIDTKITEVIAQAKDRYAALRDIILVEDLFDKPEHLPEPPGRPIKTPERTDLFDNNSTNGDSDPAAKNTDQADQSSPEINISISMDTTEEPMLCPPKAPTPNTKDDLEIDEYMNRAISNLSLDSRDHLSPILSKSPISKSQNASTSPIHKPKSITPTIYKEHLSKTTTLNDMSTSPIPIMQKSPSRSPVQRSPLTKSPIDAQTIQSKSPIPQDIAALIDEHKRLNSDSMSDAVCGSSPEVDKAIQPDSLQPSTAANESWATFEQPIEKPKELGTLRSPRSPKDDKKGVPESPCSSDDKGDWKLERENSKRWARGQTSSSSRDVSPWDDDGPDYKRRAHPTASRHGYYMRHGRRMTSGEDDFDYEEEMARRRSERRMKSGMSRSREDFDGDAPGWYHPNNHHNWSPPDDDDNDDRNRMFDRSSYERSTYGPPYEKRGEPSADRKDYKYDKRKYYHNYSRPDYDFDNYGDMGGGFKDKKISYYDDYEQRVKCRKDYDDMFEPTFSRDSRMHKSAKEFFYDREKRSFDRDSMESFDSAGRRRKSFGSGDMYGSLGSQEEFRERYGPTEKMRSLRKGMKPQRSNEEYDQDSEGEVVMHRGPGDTRSLQRPPQGSRIRKSSGSSPWDGEDLTPTSQKSWRRPASASESDRKLVDNRRVLTHTLPGSDGEKDRRFRKKLRNRGKEIDYRTNYATMRHPPSQHRPTEMSYEDYVEDSYRGGTGGPRRKLDSSRSLAHDQRGKENFEFDRNIDSLHKFSKSNREVYYHPDKDQFIDQSPGTKSARGGGKRLDSDDYDEYEKTPRSMSSNKFNFDDEQGFESDFNSPSNGAGKSLRFSNDFSEKESPRNPPPPPAHSITPNAESTPTTSQKLRFDDKIIVSQFESNVDMFEDDDFSKASFPFESEDQWIAQMPKKTLKSIKHQPDNIRKSESVNIFGKAQDDPFEDDDFFKDSLASKINNGSNNNNNNGSNRNNNGSSQQQQQQQHFNWEKNFAKFDENI